MAFKNKEDYEKTTGRRLARTRILMIAAFAATVVLLGLFAILGKDSIVANVAWLVTGIFVLGVQVTIVVYMFITLVTPIKKEEEKSTRGPEEEKEEEE